MSEQQLVPSGGKVKLTEEQRAAKRVEIAERVAIARQEKAQRDAQMAAGFAMLTSLLETVAGEFDPTKHNQRITPQTAKSLQRQIKSWLLERKKNVSFEELCQWMQSMQLKYIEIQSEYSENATIWQKLITCWDFQMKQLLVIKQWHNSLPKGTVLLDPCAGKGFFAECINMMEIPILVNDTEPQDFSFFSGETSTKDGASFILDFITKNPDVKVAFVLSWAPQMGHPGHELSEEIFTLADKIVAVQGVIHITEGMPGEEIGCTDTEDALRYKAENFTEVVAEEREYPPQWKRGSGIMPIKDYLSIAVPNRLLSSRLSSLLSP